MTESKEQSLEPVSSKFSIMFPDGDAKQLGCSDSAAHLIFWGRSVPTSAEIPTALTEIFYDILRPYRQISGYYPESRPRPSIFVPVHSTIRLCIAWLTDSACRIKMHWIVSSMSLTRRFLLLRHRIRVLARGWKYWIRLLCSSLIILR
jgi:hypothetical protein